MVNPCIQSPSSYPGAPSSSFAFSGIERSIPVSRKTAAVKGECIPVSDDSASVQDSHYNSANDNDELFCADTTPATTTTATTTVTYVDDDDDSSIYLLAEKLGDDFNLGGLSDDLDDQENDND